MSLLIMLRIMCLVRVVVRTLPHPPLSERVMYTVGEGGTASILESHSCGDESSDTGDVARTHLMTIVMTMMIIREIFVQDNYQMCVKSL